MQASCACGTVKFTTPTPQPLELFHCHCIDCRKQTGSAFGTSAIFPFFSIDTDPNVSFFSRGADSGRRMNCYFCSKCGTRLLNATIVENGNPKTVSVKGGLLEGLKWEGAQHLFCSRAVVPIPEGVVRWDEECD
ncbi:hypothetical protein P154DRAFT_459885, partial [Amniculicola lignicola CBS 123094]